MRGIRENKTANLGGGITALEIGRMKAKLYKDELAAKKNSAKDTNTSIQISYTDVEDDGETPRRLSTGTTKKKTAVSTRRETIACSNPCQRATTMEPSPARMEISNRSKCSGWEGLPEDCYTNEEVKELWADVMEQDAPLNEKNPHIERIVSPLPMIRTTVAIAILLAVLACNDYSLIHMLAGFATIVLAEYLCDYPWFQVLSGLSLGFVFALIVVLLFVFRRYTKPSVAAGVFVLGLSRLNMMMYVVSPLAHSLGLSTDLFVKFILIAAAGLLCICSSIWYCTASFPVENFRRFIKFFFVYVVGGGLVSYSFYTHAESNNDVLNYLLRNHLFQVDAVKLERAWALNAVVVLFLAIIALRFQCLVEVFDDAHCIYEDYFGPNRVRPVRVHCTPHTPNEARRISKDFTKMQLQKLHDTLNAMPEDQLIEKFSAAAYFQIQQSKKQESNSWILLYAIFLLIALAMSAGIAYFSS